MIDELFNVDKKDEDDDTSREQETEAYEDARKGLYSIYEFADTPKEAAARIEGDKDRINAEQTREEEKKQQQED